MKKGFTLVELLVVMAILGVLVTLVASGFRTAQLRGRDAQRKSDIKQLANALELFYSDYNLYPDESSGKVSGCPYTPGVGGAVCSWGQGEFTDSKTVYFKAMPKDPNSSLSYYYRVVPGSSNQKFQIFAHLENPQDPECLEGDCAAPPVAYSCGSQICNFSVTSANTTPTE
ncbi:MAG: General secretion pathway protein G [Candidatus Woesebacteria bacterium GW2011_GWB1_44_11b]|uniref:General secretion pathway protein G n=1 Tax=Candidatus Woesebacteria bacterium GW2011_GWB1_44_11b TaxID=1618580 RepID=A0A0G1IPZ9_9BACT|nr:MAG: General secretion pathway protein G [Candidatus Woesebacteria bacterium GW2011_GWB1_44_11b]